REPCIMWMPGTIEPGVCRDIACTMDLFPPIMNLAGASQPRDRVLDRLDLTPLLTGKGPSPRKTMFYYRGTELYAVRHGPYKAHFVTRSAYGKDQPVKHDPPLLFNLDVDPGEQTNVAKDHADVLAEIAKVAADHQAGV